MEIPEGNSPDDIDSPYRPREKKSEAAAVDDDSSDAVSWPQVFADRSVGRASEQRIERAQTIRRRTDFRLEQGPP